MDEVHATALAWLDDKREMLMAEFPDRWIAIHRDRVVGSAPLFDQLRLGNIDPRQLLFVFVVVAPRA